MADKSISEFMQPTFDALHCGLIEFRWQLEKFREVFTAECECGELAMLCDTHSAETFKRYTDEYPGGSISTKSNEECGQ